MRQLVALALELDRRLAREHLADDLDVLARARERTAVVVAVPTFHDLRARRAEPEHEAAARQVVERERGHRHRGRRARRDLADRRAELDALGRRAPPRERRRARRSRTPRRSSTSRSRAAPASASPSGTPAGGPAPQYPIMYPSFTARTVASRARDRTPRRTGRPEPQKASVSTGSPRRRARPRCSSCGTASRRRRCRASRSSSATATAIPSCIPSASNRPSCSPIGSQHEPIDAIYVTTLRRTHETAAPLAARLGITPIEEPDLREVFLGEWEGGHLPRSARSPRIRCSRRSSARSVGT